MRDLTPRERLSGALRVWFPDGAESVLPFHEAAFLKDFKEAFRALEKKETFAVEALNALVPYLRERPLNVWIESLLLETIVRYQLMDMRLGEERFTDAPDYWFGHAAALFEAPAFFEEAVAQWTPEEQGLFHPLLRTVKSGKNLFSSPFPKAAEVAASIRQNDPFTRSRVFRFEEERFIPAVPDDMRTVEGFFGFEALRSFIKGYFDRFDAGEKVVPLVMTGLPGVGKTQLTLAYALSHQDLTLILLDGKNLEEPLRKLITELTLRPYRKFVLFADDIDPRKLDFRTFRDSIGGVFSLPEHITLVMTSNYPFPVNVLSRSQGTVFPLFDVGQCKAMISDFLAQNGLRQPPANLIDVIAADYLEAYGQKRYEEISPRTLVRHLERFGDDKQRRLRLLEAAASDVSTRPDPDLFFEANLKRLRALYGEEGVDELRHKLITEYGLT